ncbi:protein ALP1-like [Senna tora]|uniref:Protein ALP1-like n=1 Tax=Senna tora TaxID=362788 RepID=A0A834SVH0_9FABA|nr:protein ALP1-like [Senna tora]
MMFTYVYSSWEGNAHDAKVLLDTLTNPEANFPWLLEDHSILDSGYPCSGGFLPPYRGERYHAQEYRGKIHDFKIYATALKTTPYSDSMLYYP